MYGCCISDYILFFFSIHSSAFFQYTASALSWVLGDLGKPVCITGAQIPGGRIETDARRNFVNAVRVATLSKAGVMLLFDSDIILGARSHKMSESKLDAFTPINWANHGEVRIDVRFSDEAKDRHHRPLQYRPGFETNIAVFTLFPGFPAKDIEAAISWGVKGIILRGYGSGNISYKYLDAVKLAKVNKIPVLVNSQCLEGVTLMHLYDVGKQALDNGVIQGYDMSMECLITKLMWTLKHADNYEQIREMIHTDYVSSAWKPVCSGGWEPINIFLLTLFLVVAFFRRENLTRMGSFTRRGGAYDFQKKDSSCRLNSFCFRTTNDSSRRQQSGFRQKSLGR